MIEPLAIVPLMIFLSSWVDPLWFLAFYLGSSVAWISVAAIALRKPRLVAAGPGDHRPRPRLPGDDAARHGQGDLPTAGRAAASGSHRARFELEPESPVPIVLTGEGSNT